jgi:GTP cyclohydrolase I
MDLLKEFSDSLELASTGFANGKAPGYPFTEAEKWEMVEKAEKAYGEFLDALKCDWRNDPNSAETPRRVAKAYVEKWAGRYDAFPEITAFPSNGYDGLVVESNIPLMSMCSHHHEQIRGYITIAYVPTVDGKVIGLSKLNRIVDYFGRRGQIQEQLTVQIHNAVNIICENNQGVAVAIDATHACVYCRGVKHQGASMQTTKLSGCFLVEDSARAEFMMHVSDAVRKRGCI